jgi:hypothetical protein
MNPDFNKQIWNISKWRFLQSEASFWIVRNKVLEILAFGSVVLWFWLSASPSPEPAILPKIVIVVALLAAITVDRRNSKWDGYFDGYEQGFQDAASRNLDYWGETHDTHSDDVVISQVLEDIKRNENSISEEDRAERGAQIQKGRAKAVGFVTCRFFR